MNATGGRAASRAAALVFGDRDRGVGDQIEVAAMVRSIGKPVVGLLASPREVLRMRAVEQQPVGVFRGHPAHVRALAADVDRNVGALRGS